MKNRKSFLKKGTLYTIAKIFNINTLEEQEQETSKLPTRENILGQNNFIPEIAATVQIVTKWTKHRIKQYSGTVFCINTESPIVNAKIKVQLKHQEEILARQEIYTDTNGNFCIQIPIPPENQKIMAIWEISANGYFTEKKSFPLVSAKHEQNKQIQTQNQINSFVDFFLAIA